jgi:hypothetical protein
MCHSRLEITVQHYLNDFDALEIDKWRGWSPAQILALANQRHLKEFKGDDLDRKLLLDNSQKRIQE